MKLIVPDYYDDFICIADRCKHSCCIGWEIDVDDETLEKYQNLKGSFGERLKNGIEIGECDAHFRLGENERCPFLNEKGLCDIILTVGEEYLSQICTDHPRYCSFYSDRTEIGLGLCCEEAARIILSKQTKTQFLVCEDEEESELPTEEEIEFLTRKEKLFNLAQNRNKNISERMNDIEKEIGVSFPKQSFSDWIDLFLSLECMDKSWQTLLSEAKKSLSLTPFCKDLETAWEQLLVYFIYRHVSNHERDCAGPVLFALLSVCMIQGLFAFICSQEGNCNTERLIELCRLYSSEIEYSEENTEKLSAFMEESQ